MKPVGRTKLILERSVADFIECGRPITSEYLFKKYDFGIKPAMIRWELYDLTKNGFMYQLHPSGGRLPTNKAYRFFVNSILEEPEDNFSAFSAVVREFILGRTKELVEVMSGLLRVVGVGYEPDGVVFYEKGLDALLYRLEMLNREELIQVVQDVELLEDRLSEFDIDEGLKVFIGRNPITKSEHLSLVAEKFRIREKDFLLLAIGPKRMDYRKSLRVFQSLERITK